MITRPHYKLEILYSDVNLMEYKEMDVILTVNNNQVNPNEQGKARPYYEGQLSEYKDITEWYQWEKWNEYMHCMTKNKVDVFDMAEI